MSEHVLSILVKAVGSAKAAKDLKGVDAAVSSIGARAGKGIRDTAHNIERLGVVAGGALAGGLVLSVKAAADFESQLNTINTVASLSQTQLDAVGGDIRKLARDTGASIDDLTGAYYDLVSAGVKPGADALNVLTLANTLAVGGLATTGETVDLLTTAINTYGLNAKQAATATDQFAEAIALGKVTAAEIAETFSVVGPLAQAMGIGIDEVSASYAQLTAKGIPAAEAMTDMRSALAGLAKPTAALITAQKKLGVNFAKVAKEKGLQVALAQIRKYSEKTGIPLAKLLGRIEAVQYTLSTTGNNAADYKKALEEVQNATGVAAEQMSERQGGLNFQLNLLKANARDAAITIGSKLLPKLTPLAKKAVDFLQAHEADIGKLGDDIAAAFDKAAQFAEKIPWSQVGQGLQIAADWAGKLMDAFTNLPPEVQSTIIALAGLNKLSGGAITGIVGELGKGLIKGVLGINAGVVNVRGATVTGAGGGIAGAAGKGGGLVNTVGKVFLVGAAVGVFAELKGILDDQSAANKQGEAALTGQTTGFVKVAGISEMRNSLAGIEAEEKRLNNSWDADGFAFRTNIDGVRDAVDQQKAVLKAGIAAAEARQGSIQGAIGNITPELSRLDSDFTGAIGNVTPEISRLGARVVGAVGNLTPQLSRLGSNVTGAIGNVTPQISRLSGKMDATTGAVGAVRAAIAAKDLSVALKTVIPLTNVVTVSGRDVVHQQTTFAKAGGRVFAL